MLPKSCKTAVIKYAGTASGISWQMRRAFLNLKSQFDSIHAFNVPNPPPNKLVKNKSFIVPNISTFPATSNEKLPLKIKLIPSKRKLAMGIINKSATMKEEI